MSFGLQGDFSAISPAIVPRHNRPRVSHVSRYDDQTRDANYMSVGGHWSSTLNFMHQLNTVLGKKKKPSELFNIKFSITKKPPSCR